MTKKKPAKTKADQPKKIGRPTTFRQEIADTLCEAVSSGKSMRAACREIGIDNTMVFRWIDKNEAFGKQYAKAMAVRAELLAQEIVDIADEAEVEATYQGEEVKLDLSSAAVARNRLRVDARKWVASKLLPKRYGDKVQIGGAEDLPPVVPALDEKEVARRVAFILASGLQQS